MHHSPTVGTINGIMNLKLDPIFYIITVSIGNLQWLVDLRNVLTGQDKFFTRQLLGLKFAYEHYI